MPFPVEITVRDFERTPAIDDFIARWVAKLEESHPRIERCEVLLERPHQHKHQGQPYHVRVTVAVPGPDVIVSRDPSVTGRHEDVYVALADAFRAARRQLEDQVRKIRHDVKTHVGPAHGRVTYVDAEGAWGYLEADGRQIYWHRNSVLGETPLAVGDEVRFHEEPGREGPQASSVTRVGEHGHHASMQP